MTAAQDFHDAVLVAIEVRWAEGTVTVRTRTRSGPTDIIVEGMTRVECPRSFPWGPSASINEVETTSTELTIEMQSGDTLRVIGTKVSFSSSN